MYEIISKLFCYQASKDQLLPLLEIVMLCTALYHTMWMDACVIEVKKFISKNACM